MPSAQKRAKALAKQVMKAMKEARVAEARVIALGEEMQQALKEARKEAEAAARRVVYPSGRYECAQCGHNVLFTEPAENLPKCDNCGSTTYKGHEPQIIEKKPPKPKRYQAGMYQCASCTARIAVGEDCDELPDCDFCGQSKLEVLN